MEGLLLYGKLGVSTRRCNSISIVTTVYISAYLDRIELSS